MSADDCSGALRCITPDGTEWDGEGVGQGICTQECSTDPSVCDPAGVCLTLLDGSAFCVESCVQGSVPFSSPDRFPGFHCSGRFEMACVRLDDGGGATVDACLPTCTNDLDCGNGFCNESTGTCAATEPMGAPMGAACDPQAIEGGAADPCEGFCVQIDAGAATQGFCSGLCTLGTFGLPGVCDSNPAMGSVQDAGCLFASNATAEVGDLGLCANMCDCNADCAPGLECVEMPPETVSFTLRAGLCASAGPSDVVLTTCN